MITVVNALELCDMDMALLDTKPTNGSLSQGMSHADEATAEFAA